MCDVQTLFSNYSMDVHYIVCFRTQCVWVGLGGAHGGTCEMRHVNLYSRKHAPLSVATASMPIFTVTPSQLGQPATVSRPLFNTPHTRARRGRGDSCTLTMLLHTEQTRKHTNCRSIVIYDNVGLYFL